MDKISVIMGIYNCADTLDEAIKCILDQTYENWELIMCDDSSTDDTYSVAEKYLKEMPDKVILLKNKKNEGLNATLNHCLRYATGQYIARMDGDDLCTNDRFEKEIRFLQEHREFDIVSSNMEYFDDCGVFARSHMAEFPKKEDLVFGTIFCHAPCMVTKKAYDAVDGYTEDKKLLRMEDYELWIKLYAAGYKGYNIQEPLYSMRDDRNAAKRRKYRYRINEAYVRYLAIKRLDLSKWKLVYVFRPLIVGLLPVGLYSKIHRRKLNYIQGEK